MSPGLTQPLTGLFLGEEGDKGWYARKANNVTVICESIVYRMWEPRRLKAQWASTACYRDSFIFFIFDDEQNY
jgi:hypothetical protein